MSIPTEARKPSSLLIVASRENARMNSSMHSFCMGGNTRSPKLGKPHGEPRYTVEGTMRLPNGREHLVQTVWQFDLGTDFPRLIAAHACLMVNHAQRTFTRHSHRTCRK